MTMRDNLDISAYLVLGPENTLGRPVADVVEQALDAGFTCMQIRSKVCSVRDLIEYTAQAADVIARAGKSDQVALLIDDRLDAVLAARERGIKCDGVHVGQSDIPVDVCRKLLGPDAIVGLSARCEEMAVEAALEGDLDKVYYACMFDPLTSAVLSMQEIHDMVDEMVAVSKDFLPMFKF